MLHKSIITLNIMNNIIKSVYLLSINLAAPERGKKWKKRSSSATPKTISTH